MTMKSPFEPVRRTVIVIGIASVLFVSCSGSSKGQPVCATWPPAIDVPSSLSSGDHSVLVFGRNQENGTETWRWSGSCWKQETVGANPAVFDPALVNEPNGNGVVMLGGWDNEAVDAFVARYESWRLSGGNWVEIATPEVPKLAGLAAVTTGGQTLLVGSGGASIEETWSLGKSGWQRLQPLHSPPARFNPSVAIDPVSHQAMLFGGWNFPKQVLSDTWRWDGHDWTLVDSALNISGHPVNGILVADRKSLYVLAYLGTAEEVRIWQWRSDHWTEVKSTGSPPRVQDFGVGFDGSKILLFGGIDAYEHVGNPSTAIWTWDGTRWAQIH